MFGETLALLEVLPLKTVRVVETERRTVEVLGTPFGMKMFSDGAMVVGFTDVETPQGLRNPAKEAGLKLGDLLVSLNGQKELNNDRAAEAVQKSGGRPGMGRPGSTARGCGCGIPRPG